MGTTTMPEAMSDIHKYIIVALVTSLIIIFLLWITAP